jgi:nucleotide-binding universal stress UspA family protein
VSWKKICCPVDFSRESRIAMEEAAFLAWRLDGRVTLVHVSELPVPPAATEMLAPPETFVLGAVDLDRKLNLWRDDAEGIAGTPVDVALLSGAPAVEITRFARDGGHDVIVMGTRGEKEREHLDLGSVAQAVVRDAPCTVVVVRRGPSPPPSAGPS